MSTRSTRSSRKKKPNAALYVGYVEDDETPDMIMKKFAAMEQLIEKKKEQIKIRKAVNNNNKKSDKAEMSDSDDDNNNNNGNDNKDNSHDIALDEDQLVSLFHDTSYYSINSLQKNNDIMFQKQTVDADGFVVGIDDPDYDKLMFEVDYDISNTAMMDWLRPDDDAYIGPDEFWADDDDDDVVKPKRNRSTSYSRGPRKPRYGGFVGHNIGSASLGSGSGVSAGGKSHKPKLLCHEPFYMKIPAYPIPRSWLKSIKLYNNKKIDDYVGYKYIESDLLAMKSTQNYFNNKKYVAILMDPPFDLSNSIISDNSNNGHVTLDQFSALPIGSLIPESGMLFIWVPSELTMEINIICEKWGFLLVEHATWILRNISYQIENRDSNLYGLSKQNLLLYRRTKKNGKSFGKLELRHQRTSDSYFDFSRYHSATGRELKSDYHYKVIETLLPDLDQKEKSQALFLWAPKNEKRDGWHMISDTKQLQILNQNKPNMNTSDW